MECCPLRRELGGASAGEMEGPEFLRLKLVVDRMKVLRSQEQGNALCNESRVESEVAMGLWRVGKGLLTVHWASTTVPELL